MTERVHEMVSVVVAAQKVERMLFKWAKEATDDERAQVRNHFSGLSDQRALDIWTDAIDIVDRRD